MLALLAGQTQLKITIIIISNNGLLTSSVRLKFSKSSYLLGLFMIIHEAVFVAEVLGHIQVSFTIFFICALYKPMLRQTFFSFKFISRNLILVQLHYYLLTINCKILTTILTNYMNSQGVLCTELHPSTQYY